MREPLPRGRPEGFLETAAQIGGRLEREAIAYEGRCTWLGDDMEPVGGSWQVTHRTMGGELYSGTSGIALSLARLSRATGEEGLRTVSIAAMRQALWLYRNTTGGDWGLYDGRSGVAWAAVEVGRLVDADELVAAGAKLIGQLASEILPAPGPVSADLISGAPGTLVAFLALAATVDDERLLEASVELGDRLVSGAHRTRVGWSWPSEAVRPGSPHLCGLAHGASGVGHALLELWARTEEARFREAAAQAAWYERCWFDRRQNGWPDLREVHEPEAGHPPPCPTHWCHGAVGIGLARLRAYELTGDQVALAEAGTALQAARAAAARAMAPGAVGSSTANFSLCHGLGGTAELLTLAYDVLGVEEHLRAAQWIASEGIARAEARGGSWPCGVPGGGDTPGLMLGLAGIGACCLRLHDPSLTPPIALLGAAI